ncbi:hypothetical protein [Vulcanisaeta distributa]|uniref:hypothetical protein n=1 Tax=Vulcanisaeta distributa TaxID=164451 RepID=UPI0006CF4917|nr:hypothetical protein [Vulcanisaeta distributa]
MGECCPGGSISAGDATRVAYDYVYSMYRDQAFWNMYRLSLKVVRAYRYGCVYNVIINVTLTPISLAFDRGGNPVRRTHRVQVDPCTGGDIISVT